MVANQALYIHYNSRHGHTNYGQNGKSPTINNIESECQPLLNSSKINKCKVHQWRFGEWKSGNEGVCEDGNVRGGIKMSVC